MSKTMTAYNITPDRLLRLAGALHDASAEVAYFSRVTKAGEITPEQAAKELERVMKKVNQAANVNSAGTAAQERKTI